MRFRSFVLAILLGTSSLAAADTLNLGGGPDLELMARVRRAIVKDKSLSITAHNVHIAAKDGVVTLTGPVRSDAEKTAVGAKAAEVAGGADKIKNEVEVSPR